MGKIDRGPNGTKILKDSRKLSKILKDMYDIIYCHCERKEEVQKELRVYGLLISGLRMDFVSLRYVRGRYHWMEMEQNILFPPVWDDGGVVSPTITAVLSRLIAFKGRIEQMSEKVTRWTQTPGLQGTNLDSEPIVATLSLPA
ncbi:hypothetical protein BGX21_002084 [Mortierella sp. AD011]|nr:hypothetical protein BGX21_002084 [Mortierella sp. AD011]